KPLPAKPTRVFKDTAKAQAVAVSPNGEKVAWAIDGKVTVTSATGNGARRTLPATTSSGTSGFALGFNPAGDRIGVLGRDPWFRVWNVSDAEDEVKEVWKARLQRRVKGTVTFSPDGKYLTAVSTAQLLVFDATDGKDNDETRRPLMQFERYADNGEINQAAFSP